MKYEIKEIEMISPIKYLNIGDIFFYSGNYFKGYEEGWSKIKGFYYQRCYLFDIPLYRDKNSSDNSVMMVLENGKKILLGYLNHKDEFKLSDTFKDKFKLCDNYKKILEN